MRGGYSSAAWSDIKSSPGWLGKLLVLTLVGLIPVFGDIVLLGYLFGWARDLAWGVRAPLPAKVFRNADGMMYARGFFCMVIAFLFCLPLVVVAVLLGGLFGLIGEAERSFFDNVFYLVSLFEYGYAPLLVVALLSIAFAWVGSMRMSIYGRLAPGLQVGKVAAMLRHDAGGLARIMGTGALLAVLSWLVMAVFVALLLGMTMLLAFLLFGDAFWQSSFNVVNHGVVAVMGFAVCGIVAFQSFMSSAAKVLVGMVVVRSLGYWMIQFQVPSWGGQDDPMPFQVEDSCLQG